MCLVLKHLLTHVKSVQTFETTVSMVVKLHVLHQGGAVAGCCMPVQSQSPYHAMPSTLRAALPSFTMYLCCAVLCCAVLCCAVLCCAVLRCVLPCHAMPCCAVVNLRLHSSNSNDLVFRSCVRRSSRGCTTRQHIFLLRPRTCWHACLLWYLTTASPLSRWGFEITVPCSLRDCTTVSHAQQFMHYI